MKLPRTLQRRLANLSSTIQELVCNMVLAIEGYTEEPDRKAQTEYEYAQKNKRATEQLALQLREFLGDTVADDVAIAIAADAGRSTREIALFFELEQPYVMRRLCAIRKGIGRGVAQPVERRPLKSDVEGSSPSATVLELFAEAQGKRGA